MYSLFFAVDECGVCQGSSDCPFEFDMTIDYPFVTESLFDEGSLERAVVSVEVVEALALLTSIPVDHFTVIGIHDVGTSAIDFKVVVRIKGGG
jgi:hypothetical protein